MIAIFRTYQALVIPLLFFGVAKNGCLVRAWTTRNYQSCGHSFCSSRRSTREGEWSIADDWSSLTLENPENSLPDSGTLFNQDLASNAAHEIEESFAGPPPKMSEEDIWIHDAVDEIHNSFSTLDDPPLYDTSFGEGGDNFVVHSTDDMSNEIAMLVRCNEHPEELLISEGRALPPLTDEEKNHPSQLVLLTEDECEATEFLRGAVSKTFRKHATPGEIDGVMGLDRAGVAKWMTEALKSEKMEGRVSAHDKRVLKTMSDYSSYGSGRLLEENFQHLYLSTVVGDTSKVAASVVSPARHLQLRQPFIDVVWRDLRNHNILSPAEKERKKLADELRAKNGGTKRGSTMNDEGFVDECEILDWDFRPEISIGSEKSQLDKREAKGSKSSHRGIELASDNKTPIWARDGDFVFIDEESCIGCTQCANVSPNSFFMLETGRARTFNQRKTPDVQAAVASCPVNCMHHVSYQELQEFEVARDEGDGRTDHKHLGHRRGHTPLFVAGIDSDANHRTSWYHTLKHKCLMSSQCPQKGCYDCPKFSQPGENPFFQQKEKKAEHIRAHYFIEHGDVDAFRKTADL